MARYSYGGGVPGCVIQVAVLFGLMVILLGWALS